jgi:hypothetical protein
LWITGTSGLRISIASRRWRRRSAAGLIRLQCEGALIGNIFTSLAPWAFAAAIARSTAARCPATHDLARRVQVRGLHHLALRGLGEHCGQLRVVQSHDGGDAAGALRHRLLHRLRAQTHRGQGSSKRSAPAATSAVYSPRLWPAKNAGMGPPRSRHARQQATPATSMSGCVFTVWFWSSAGPSFAIVQ